MEGDEHKWPAAPIPGNEVLVTQCLNGIATPPLFDNDLAKREDAAGWKRRDVVVRDESGLESNALVGW